MNDDGEPAVYERRFLLYVDVLGWRNEIVTASAARMMQVLRLIHVHAEERNEFKRQEYREREGSVVEIAPGRVGRVRVLPAVFEVQFGAFSDHFVYSMPEKYGSSILSAGTKLVVDLLRLGFLCRGAVVLGDVYHCDNVIFGPALIEAHDIESKEAIFPRIVISRSALDQIGEEGLENSGSLVITDMLGCPFWIPFTGGDQNGVLESFVRMNFHLMEVKENIDRNTRLLESGGQLGPAEKWKYLRRLIEGPVLDAEPRLRSFWTPP